MSQILLQWSLMTLTSSIWELKFYTCWHLWPNQLCSLGKNNSFFLFIDVFSRKTWINTSPKIHPPPQIGCKKKNRTLIDMARIMVKNKKLPKGHWAKSMAGTNYLSNRYPTRSVGEWNHKKHGKEERIVFHT